MKWSAIPTASWIVFLGDCILVCLALLCGALVRHGDAAIVLRLYKGAALIFVVSFLISFYIVDLYSLQNLSPQRPILRLLFVSCLFATLASSTLLFFFSGQRSEERRVGKECRL